MLVPSKGAMLKLPGLAAALASAGCAVGPNFETPRSLRSDFYTFETLPSATQTTAVAGGEAQNFQFGGDLKGEWWTLFGSTQLDALIDDAMTRYPDIAAQQAALRASQEDVRAEKGVFFPQVQGAANYSREKMSGGSIGPGFPGFITNVFQATVNVSYNLDPFGGERRLLEGLQARAQAQNFQLEASYLTLSSNVASTVIQLASITDQISATLEIIAIENNQLDFIVRRFEAGSQTRADVLQQQSNLALIRATLPALEQRRSAAEHQLAVLTGYSPHDIAPPPFTLSDLTLPRDLPVSLPSSLVAQRPDVKEQESLVHQACTEVGVATSNMLPQFTISGSVGNESSMSSSLFQPGSGIWNLTAGITQPLFEGGTLRAKRRAAMDNYDRALAQYRLTVLKAFQNVADTLTALEHDAAALRAEYDAFDAAKASLALIQKQYDAGAVSYVSLLAAEQTYQQARLGYVQAVSSRFTETVTLFQALGGGWWNRSDPGTLKATVSAAPTDKQK
jgi:NodT family efflux transporter outer membrane factor (OMF) lipoprotein